jgi:uncharacterized membrane protein YhdT
MVDGDAENHLRNTPYILGFPAWIFWTIIIGSMVFLIITILIALFVFKDMSLESWLKKEINR